MIKRGYGRKHTKTGCCKPRSPMTSLSIILALILFAALLPAFGLDPAAAQDAVEVPEPERPAMADSRLTYKPGEVLVKFSSGEAAARIGEFLEGAGLADDLEEVFREGGELLTLLRLDGGMSVKNAVWLLSPLAGVLYAEPNYIAHALYTPADPDYDLQWGLENTGQDIGRVGTPGADIGAPEAWDLEKGFTDPVTVAVIDTGMDATHPDLDDKIWNNGGEVPGNGIDDDVNGYVDDATGFNWAGITQSRFYYRNTSSGAYTYTVWRFGYDPTRQKFAQSIKGTGQDLTHVGVLLQKVGSPSGGITVSLRSTIDGADLASFSISPAEVSSGGSEVYKELSAAQSLADGTTYYLVFQTANNSTSDYYYMYHNYSNDPPDAYTDQYDCYRDGQEYRWDGDASWLTYAKSDFFFITNPNANPRDDNGHGTHVGGIVGAEEGNAEGGVGVSFGAGLMPLKVMDCTGSGSYDDITAAIYYAADNGAEVINMSLGGTGYSQAMQEAVDHAHDAGVVVLAASGNSGDSTMQYPAGCDNVIGVGATTNKDEIASFSTFNASVDVSAPGRYIYSTMPTYAVALNSWGYAQDYDYLSGTSMATPMAAGLAALVLSAEPRYGSGQVEQWMEQFADDKSPAGRDDYFGYGRINAYATLAGMPPWPEVTGIEPPSDRVGAQVIVEGTAFGSTRGSSYVSFGGMQAAQYDSWSDESIVCHVPAGVSGLAEVVVTTPVGSSNHAYFSVLPGIMGIEPGSGPVGRKVTITGSAFGSTRGSSSVSFGGEPVSIYDSWADGSIACYVPVGVSGQVEVTVTTAGGTSNAAAFNVTAPATTWYLAEGSTSGGMETYVLVQNPGDTEARVTLSFMTGEGPRNGPTAVLPAGTRKTFKVNDYVTSWDVSTRVSSDSPVVAERAMYGNSRTWAHDSVGAIP